MRLQKLVLENFQGVKALTLDFPGGCSGSIYGDNATGKTTIFNALTWILFGRPSTGAKNFTPQTRGPEGEIHHLEHSVMADFILEDGQQVSLKKIFKENWKKKRGAVNETLDGHTTDYYIDGVPVKEKEYENTVLSDCGGDANRMMILTMPDYFPEQMKWEDRRKILLTVCGDVTDKEVIASNSELAELPELLKMPGDSGKSYAIDDFKKVIAGRRRDINKELDSIPARIDEVEKAIPDTKGLDEKALHEKAAGLSKELDTIEAEIVSSKNKSTVTSKVTAQIAQIEAEQAQAKADYIKEQGVKTAAENEIWLTKKAEKQDIELQIKQDEISKGSKEIDLEAVKKGRDRLLKEWNEVSAMHWDSGSEICPTCGQRLPADKIAELQGDFNEKKAEKFKKINEEGATKYNKDRISALEMEISDLTSRIEKNRAKAAALAEEIQEHSVNAIPAAPFEGTEKGKEYEARITELKTILTDEAAIANKAVEGLREQEKEKREELTRVQTTIAQFAAAEKQVARKTELEAHGKELSKQFDDTEKALYLADLFTKTKVGMLTEKINEKFKSVSFQLFVEQINGGLKEGCEVLVPGEGGRMIPYAYANNAARINAGLEIIGVLSDYWKLKLPVVLDNAESNTHPLKIDTQVIKLYVSEADKELRLVTEKEN